MKFRQETTSTHGRFADFRHSLPQHATIIEKAVLFLWPFVPAALALAFSLQSQHKWIFGTSFIAMIPAASTLGLAGRELTAQIPSRIVGILVETFLGTVVESLLLIFLITQPHNSGSLITVIRAAILGSILANILLCLGMVLLVGGLKHEKQTFHGVITETCSDVLLAIGTVIVLTSVFYATLRSTATDPSIVGYSLAQLEQDTLSISRGVAVILAVSFIAYMLHHIAGRGTAFDDVLQRDHAHNDLNPTPQPRTRLIPSTILLLISLASSALLAYILVREIEPIVHSTTISENFMGLILVPLVEKIAERVTSIDKAWSGHTSIAIFHCISPSIQTGLFNAPLVVVIGWALDKPMDLSFEVFQMVSLVLALVMVVVVLQGGTSNALAGFLLVAVYVVVALIGWFIPGITAGSSNSSQP
jgi:Ca2+:H+ antiporter